MVAELEIADHMGHMPACRVYICDDSPEYRMLLRMVLADAGATVVGEGGDGAEALADAKASDPSLVLLDLNMPGLGGLEALPRLREQLPGEVKIVVLTTSKAPETERSAMELGADAYVSKPIDATSVPRLLREKLAS
jgi:two-component system, chemotaxis family, protein-glutamate methylesterase/glutaminase